MMIDIPGDLGVKVVGILWLCTGVSEFCTENEQTEDETLESELDIDHLLLLYYSHVDITPNNSSYSHSVIGNVGQQ